MFSDLILISAQSQICILNVFNFKIRTDKGTTQRFWDSRNVFCFLLHQAVFAFLFDNVKWSHHYLPVCLSFFAQSLCHHRIVSCSRCFLKFPTRPTLKDETLPNHQQPKKVLRECQLFNNCLQLFNNHAPLAAKVYTFFTCRIDPVAGGDPSLQDIPRWPNLVNNRILSGNRIL